MKRKFAILLFLGLLLLVVNPPQETYAQGGIAQLGFFEEYEVRPGNRIEVPVEVRAVEELYAVDIEISYDPDLLVFDDAEPDKLGVQPGLGTFLEAGLTLMFEVDEEQGLVRFVMTQVNPAEPQSGNGVLLALYFVGLGEGEAHLSVNSAELATRFGEAIPVELVDSVVTVSAASEVREATPIPVQDPALMIPIPTLMATPIPTVTQTSPPTETIEPTPVELESETGEKVEVIDEVDEVDKVSEVFEETGEEQDAEVASGFSILRYWWAVLLTVLLAAGLIVYYIKVRRQ